MDQREKTALDRWINREPEEHCCICGEPNPDAEMFKDDEGGLCHAECGLQKGWEIA